MQSQSFIIQGEAHLEGDITPQGAKNEALQIISACLLTDQPVTLHNVPDILDVQKLLGLIEGLGVEVRRTAPESYIIKAKNIDLDHFASNEYQNNARKIRGSIMLLAPLLARFGKAFIPKPGGDKIGRRRLDTHFLGFKALGAELIIDDTKGQYYLHAKRLKGRYILMDEISVTGSANMIMASVLAEGTTTLYNVACEPYIQQLCKMLVRMGADINGVGSNLLTINGVSSLHGTEHTILPDMIEIGSFIGMGVLTNSPLRIKNCRVDQLGNILPVFKKLGVQMTIENDDILLGDHSHYQIGRFMDDSIMTIYDAPWPGFTPDLMSIILVMSIQAKGSVLIHQKMFESRLFFVDKLIDMGAQIILCDPHRATVIGLNRESQLRGIRMSSPDIRAGVALLIAALSAKGESIINNIHQIDRGYQNIDTRLNALGADIRRIQ